MKAPSHAQSRLALIALSLVLVTSPVGAQSGHTSWGPWSFDWEVANKSGIGIRNVQHNGTLFIYKGSLPVIRVKYTEDFGWEPWHWDGCGPYADRITWDNLVPTTVSSSKVLQRSFTSGGTQWLELGGYARIGAYHIYQAWYFSEGGTILARLWSKGLSCDMDHDHHPYWRIDADVRGAAVDQIFFRETTPSGTVNTVYSTERNDTKNPPRSRRWYINDQTTGSRLWIYPGSADGFADAFSTKDMGARLYHGDEDTRWIFGASGHLGYGNGEAVNSRDVVFWYVGHMHHVASEGPDHWGVVGPTLVVQH